MNSFIELPPSENTEVIKDFIATRVERAFKLSEEGNEEEAKSLLQSAYAMALEADDQESLGFLYITQFNLS